MVSLLTQQQLREVQRLGFCYLCGHAFAPGDQINRDHVPAQAVFAREDRQPLWLPTHVSCNKSHEMIDEKIGQLIALRQGRVPSRREHKRLRFTVARDFSSSAVTNLDIHDAVWRWIAGFHAALYSAPAVGIKGSLVTPFPMARRVGARIVVQPLLPQHGVFVAIIRVNRAKGNLDQIRCNKGQLAYECVWVRSDDNGPWMCIFALDVCDWKDLGRTPWQQARGCAGFYILPTGEKPVAAAIGASSRVIIPSRDPLDPFA